MQIILQNQLLLNPLYSYLSQALQQKKENHFDKKEKWREKLGNKRKEVEFWMNKVDKSCIERIRAFQTPPVLIGTIMEMSKHHVLFVI